MRCAFINMNYKACDSQAYYVFQGASFCTKHFYYSQKTMLEAFKRQKEMQEQDKKALKEKLQKNKA